MSKYSLRVILVQKSNKFILMQCSKNDAEDKEMESISYTFVISSLMYLLAYTRLDNSFVVKMLGRCKSNPKMDHQKVAKKY